MKKWVIGFILVLLLVAHQDYWQWDRHELVFGFVPHNMFWHMGLSLVTALAWIVVCIWFWPRDEGVKETTADSATPDSNPLDEAGGNP